MARKMRKKALFGKSESMFGELKGIASTKDIIEEDIHEDLFH